MKKLTVLFSLLTLMLGIAIVPAAVISANANTPAAKRTTPKEISKDNPNIVNEISFATHSIS